MLSARRSIFLMISSLIGATRSSASHSASAMLKRVTIVRHGQAVHNPRAEAAKAAGCDMDEFVRLMREDDALDAPLTELGRQQAVRAATDAEFDLVVASPLSRALETADVISPAKPNQRRHVCELFREVNGDLLNAKRRTTIELQESFPDWSFEDLLKSNEDDSWTEGDMEPLEGAAERGYLGLCWLLQQPENDMLLVGHGGILRYMMNIHPLIRVVDGRIDDEAEGSERKDVQSRFDNCELRRYTLEEGDEIDGRRTVVLTQI